MIAQVGLSGESTSSDVRCVVYCANILAWSFLKSPAFHSLAALLFSHVRKFKTGSWRTHQ